MTFDGAHYLRVLEACDPIQVEGRVVDVVGTVIEGHVPDCSIGQLCEIFPGGGERALDAEIVGFRGDRVLIMALGEMRGLKPGSPIIALRTAAKAPVGLGLLGRVLDGQGRPMDGRGPLKYDSERELYGEPVNAMARARIRKPMDLGIRAINGLLTCGVGQRIAIMAGSGVGKSTLLGMIARKTKADINVIALVGERGRELNDFIERDLGPEGLARSILVVATSDTSPLIRVRAAFVATAIAEHFRDEGADVLLMMDSVTRFAMAQREIGLSIGEPPTSKGYTPSVFALLPKLLERAGMGESGGGSITGLYSVLVEGDDMNEPIADAVRAILDGHIVLSRRLAEEGHFPAIDVLASKSRLMNDIAEPSHIKAAIEVVGLLAAHRRAEIMIDVGAYVRGSNPKVDRAMDMQPAIELYLKQGVDDNGSMSASVQGLNLLAEHAAEGGAETDREKPMEAAAKADG